MKFVIEAKPYDMECFLDHACHLVIGSAEDYEEERKIVQQIVDQLRNSDYYIQDDYLERNY